MFMKMLNILSSVMLSASCVNGLSSLYHKPVKQIENNNVLVTDYNYSLNLWSPYSSFMYPLYTIDGDLYNNYYSSFDMNYSSLKQEAFTIGNDITYNDNAYAKFVWLSNGDDTLFWFLLRRYDIVSQSVENFYNNLVLINSNMFATLNYARFYITWDFCFIKYEDHPNNVLVTSFNTPYEYRGDNLTIDDNTYYVFRNYRYSPLITTSYSSLDDIYYDNINDYLFYSRVHVSYNTTSSYGDGYNDGYNVGYGEGHSTGYTSGYNTGYTAGQQSTSRGRNLFLSIADTPMLMLRSLFNFDFFVVNFFIIVIGLLTMLFVIYLVKKFI